MKSPPIPSEQREIVVNNHAKIVLMVFGPLILIDPAIAKSRRESVEKTPFRPPLEIGVKFIFIGHPGLCRWIDSSPAMNEEQVGGHTFQAETRKVVRQLGDHGLFFRPIKILYLDAGITRIAAPGALHIISAQSVRITEGENRAAKTQVALHPNLIRRKRTAIQEIITRASLVRELDRQ